MSLEACIPQLLAEGKLTPEQAERAEALYGRRKRHHERNMGAEAAAAAASEDAVSAIEREAAQSMRQKLLQVAVQKRAIADMAKYRGDKPGAAAIALIARDERAPYSNFEYRWKEVRGSAHAFLDQLLLKHRRNLRGEVRYKADLEDVVRELFGHDTGNVSAKEMADAWRSSAEMLRQRFNAAGGAIGKLDRWGLPQAHDSVLVGEAGFDNWSAFILPLLDRERMIDAATGKPFDDETLDAVLRDVFETISTDGWAGREPGAQGKGKLANARAEHRFLHFADAEGWMAYQERFGGAANAFDAMMGHIDGMARDIAAMEILGPNPAATVKWLQDGVAKQAALEGGRGKRRLFGLRPGRLRRDQARMDANVIGQLFDEAMGKNRAPHNRSLALGFSALRSWQVSTKLGSAVLSTTSDQATQLLTRGFNGLPIARMGLTQAKLLNPLDAGDRAFAIRSGLIAEEASQIASAQARFTGEELTGETSRRMAEAVLRVSGLSAVTQSGRWAFGMDFLSALTDESVKGWSGLSGPFRNMFERYGLGEADWDRIRATPLEIDRGAPWLHPRNIDDRALRSRVMEMILTETDFAVPVPGLRVQAAINARAQSGTLLGELLRTGFQFKSFPVTLMMMQGQRMMAQQGWNKAAYAAAFLTLTTLAGALTLDMKDIAKGKDPRSNREGEFWLEAFAQGGGGGIYGDFIRSAESRAGSGFEQTLKGPAWQSAKTFEDLTVSPVMAAFQGKKVNEGKRLARAARSETPFGTVFYLRLAFERLWLDQLQEWADPDVRASRRRLEREAAKRGQDYFWEPGAAAPERAPDLGNIFEEGEE